MRCRVGRILGWAPILLVLLSACLSFGQQATFLRSDTTTQGNWKTSYGTDGYNVISDTTSYPSYATVSPTGQSSYTWASSTTDIRALQKASVITSRIAGTWYSGSSFSIDVNLTDGQTHQVAVYCMDWDNSGRAQTVQVLNAQTQAVLDTRSMSAFVNGQYLVWSITGHVKISVTRTCHWTKCWAALNSTACEISSDLSLAKI